MLFTESKLKSSQRTDFGLPSKKKYPMPDKDHVLAAIRMFNHVDKEDEKELAENIIIKMRQYDIPPETVGKTNRLYPYVQNAKFQEAYSIDVLEEHEIINSLICMYQDRPISEALDSRKVFNEGAPITLTPEMQQMIIAKLAELGIYIIVNKLARLSFKRFAIKEIKREVGNKKIYDYLKNNIDEIYKKHKNYVPCTKEDFKKTNIFERFAAEFRDKKTKEVVIRIGKTLIDDLIDLKILPSFIPSYHNLMVALGYPIKVLFSGLGLSLKLGSVYRTVLTFEGKCIHMGLDLTPHGFRIVNIQLYSFKLPGHKMVSTQIKDIPEEMYKPTKADLAQFIKKYPGKTLKEIKKELEDILSYDK